MTPTDDRRIGRGRVADQIVDDLRERILSGKLPDGARLPAERELAEEYGVSGVTIREAVRGLATIGLVDVRHGAGTFVTAETDTMIGMSIASVARLGGVGAREVLGLLGALNRHAAQLAAAVATDDEIASLRAAAEKLAVVDDLHHATEDLRAFLRRMAEISHDALLIPLCRLLADLQIELATELSHRPAVWRQLSAALHPHRMALVEAVESRSPERAAAAVDAFSEQATRLILSTPRAEKVRLTDPVYARLLAGLLDTRLTTAR